jgi:hypothetical protein
MTLLSSRVTQISHGRRSLMRDAIILRIVRTQTFLPVLTAGLLIMAVGEGLALVCDPPAGTLGCGDVVTGDTGNGINDA